MMLQMSRNGIQRAARIVAQGGVVAFPTDTVYGLGCNPTDQNAVDRLFQVKGRGPKAVPLLCQDIEYASTVITLKGPLLALANRYWPGALTVVAPSRINLPESIHQKSGNLGVRVPAHEKCVTLLHECGGFLTGTSANVSGRPACRNAVDVSRELGSKVDLILDGGGTPGVESTVVKVTRGRIEVLRQGALRVSEKELRGII
jgi:L-threonylcarbamoyladenylate synthase